MRILTIPIIILILCQACSKKSSCDETYTTTIFERNKQLKDSTIFYGIDSVQTRTEVDGNNLVFKYSSGDSPCRLISDAYSEFLNFQINPLLTGFEYRDSSILATKCYYYFTGFISSSPQKIVKGLIKGTKISATRWDIEVQVSSFGHPISFEKTFTLSH